MKILNLNNKMDEQLLISLNQDELLETNGGWCLINGIGCFLNSAKADLQENSNYLSKEVNTNSMNLL